MWKKKSDFNFIIMNSRIGDTELTAVLLAYISAGFRTGLIAPFPYISIISLQRNTVILLEEGKEYDSEYINIRLILEVIKLSKIDMGSFMPFFFFSSDIVGLVLQLKKHLPLFFFSPLRPPLWWLAPPWYCLANFFNLQLNLFIQPFSRRHIWKSLLFSKSLSQFPSQ